MPLFAAHVATSLVYIKLKLLPSGGENSTTSLQREAILLGLLCVHVNIVCTCVCVYIYMHLYGDRYRYICI